MRVAFFLGAGFSKAAGFPVMTDFSRSVRALEADSRERQCLRACIDYAKATCAFINADIENIEHVMSVISLAAITSPNGSLPNKHMHITFVQAIEMLKGLVRRVYGGVQSIRALDPYKRFFGAISDFREDPNNRVEIITTNYDMLAETLLLNTCERHVIAPPLGQVTKVDIWEQANVGEDFGNIGGHYNGGMYDAKTDAKVYKLHGSVNWFRKEDDEKAEDVTCYHGLLKMNKASNWLKCFPIGATEAAEIPQGMVPVIVPPSMVKHYGGCIIQEAWQGATNAIALADKLIFIGYSFPPTDTIMKYFLGTALARNGFVCRVAVIDKYPDRVKASLEDMFPKSRYESVDFKEVDFPELIQGKPFGKEGFGTWLAS